MCSGDVEWGCGFRPEMIPDKTYPGFWQNTSFCPKHIHLHDNQSNKNIDVGDDYNSIDCNVSR